jgi:phosphatidate cytidylyltransferase
MSMADADPARPPRGAGSDLALRVGSALALVPLALGFTYVGGAAFAIFWGIAAVVVMWEWTLLVSAGEGRPVLMVAVATVLLAVALAAGATGSSEPLRQMRVTAALTVLAIGMLAAAALAARGRGGWVAAGIPYAGALGVAPIVLRSDPEFGFVAMLYLFAVVWGTDIAAYFVGRAIGGPKLAPRMSPKKTWAGAIGGIAGGVIAALLVVKVSGLGNVVLAAAIAFALSVVAQVGDLFESVLKRRFGAKDSSYLIPGHGGLMDRLDSFVAAAVVACVIGVARGGIDAPARGLLLW